VTLLVLLSLFFNIAHAGILKLVDECDHSEIEVFVYQMDQETGCEDVCDIHHHFHFVATIEKGLELSVWNALAPAVSYQSDFQEEFPQKLTKPPATLV